MKKILAFAVMAVMTLSAAAQDWYVGGSLGAWRDGTNHTTNLNIAPELGANISETWAIGAVVGFNYNHAKSNGVKVNSSLVTFDPYARYTYFRADRLSLFMDGGVDLGFGKTKVGDASSDTAVTWGLGLKPGVSYGLTDNFSLVAHFGFFGYKDGNDAAKAGGAHTQWGLDLSGYNLSFGFYYSF